VRVVKVESWEELPEFLDKGVYIIGGKKLILYEGMPKYAAKRLVKITEDEGDYV